jgi:signal transduction histidine kinase
MLFQSNIRTKAQGVFEKYGVLLAGVFIFAYYLWVAIDHFVNPHARRDFQGYFFQFSSVVLLWGLTFLGAKLFEHKKKQREEAEKNAVLVQEYERRRMQLELLDEMSEVLNDTVNNPLSVISISAASIRDRFQPDDEVLAYLDNIDGALKRVAEVLADFKSYQTTKIVGSLQKMPSRLPRTEKEFSRFVTPSGDIQGS